MQDNRYRLRSLAIAAATPFLLTAACTPSEPAETTGQRVSYAAIAEAYTNAFNHGDLDAIAEFMHPEIEWYVEENGEMVLITSGKDNLIEEVSAYFEDGQTTTSILSEMQTTATGVTAVETVSWIGDDGDPRSQSAPVTYTITEDGLIRRVEYLGASTAEHETP
ncbi:MAG: nuclear transport factor 2 family protein [Henriciella sp.]